MTKFKSGTYTPKRNYYFRDSHEALLRRLALECNKTPFKDDLSHLSDNELLVLVNGFLSKLGLQKYTTEELQRPLSLKTPRICTN
jgi:hypothetical protein